MLPPRRPCDLQQAGYRFVVVNKMNVICVLIIRQTAGEPPHVQGGLAEFVAGSLVLRGPSVFPFAAVVDWHPAQMCSDLKFPIPNTPGGVRR